MLKVNIHILRFSTEEINRLPYSALLGDLHAENSLSMQKDQAI